MFFTKCAMVIAVLGLIGAAGQIYLGFSLLQMDSQQQAAAGISSGKHFDRGGYMLLFSFALGTLAEISFNIRKGVDKAQA
jgi:phage tail tape-measure protein